jgi:hypothetical protein
MISFQINPIKLSYQISIIDNNSPNDDNILDSSKTEELLNENDFKINIDLLSKTKMVINGNNRPIVMKSPIMVNFQRNKLSFPNLTIVNAPGSIIESQMFDGVYINLTNSPNSIVRNNIIQNIWQDSNQYAGVGIYLQNSSNTLVMGNDIDNITSINSASLGILVSNSTNVRIINNLITGVGSSDNSGVSGTYGIRLDNSSDHSIVIDNDLNNINSINSPLFGIMTELVDNVTIFNNHIHSVMLLGTGSDVRGIHIKSSTGVLIENNRVEAIEATTFSNQVFSAGISLDNSFAAVINNQISGIMGLSNSRTHVYGIFLTLGSVAMVNNRVVDIVSNGPTIGNSYGIYYFDVNNTETVGPNIVENIIGLTSNHHYFVNESYSNRFVFIPGFEKDLFWSDTSLSIFYNSFEITDSGIPINFGPWTPSDIISIPIIGNPIQDFEYNIKITGPGQPDINVALNVSIIPNFFPLIEGPSDTTLEEGTTDILLSWNVTDSEPGNFTILLDNNKILDGFWNSGQIIDINIGDLIVGTYNYTFLATDMYLTTNLHSVIVFVVDTTSPTILGPDSLEIEERVNNSIVWEISDRNLENVVIFMNNETVFNNSWVFDTALNFSLVELPVGEYNFTVQAIDVFGNSATATTFVFALDTTAPAVNGPSRVLVKEGDQGKKIAWEVFDWNPRNFSIFRNNLLVENGSWEGLRTIDYSLDDLSFGIWNFTLILQDLFNHTSSNSVTVSVSTGGDNTTTTDILGFDDATIFITGAAIGVSIVVVGGIVILRRRR